MSPGSVPIPISLPYHYEKPPSIVAAEPLKPESVKKIWEKMDIDKEKWGAIVSKIELTGPGRA
jgi:hypothetical protein